jgi:hypothetical protein
MRFGFRLPTASGVGNVPLFCRSAVVIAPGTNPTHPGITLP